MANSSTKARKNSSEGSQNTTVVYPQIQENIAFPVELFEKLDVARYNPGKNFGDAGPIALAGLVMVLTPLACQLMGWRGSDSSGAANKYILHCPRAALITDSFLVGPTSSAVDFFCLLAVF
jgi:hypothetical protein